MSKKLTKNQQGILRMLANGKSHKEMAKEKYVSVCTIKSSLRRLYKNMKAKNAPNAVYLWLKAGGKINES